MLTQVVSGETPRASRRIARRCTPYFMCVRLFRVCILIIITTIYNYNYVYIIPPYPYPYHTYTPYIHIIRIRIFVSPS